MPSGLAELLPGIFDVGGRTVRQATRRAACSTSSRRPSGGAESWLLGSYHGAMHHTATFLVMAHDDAAGRLASRWRPHRPSTGRMSRRRPCSSGSRRSCSRRRRPTARPTSAIPIQNTFLGKNLITVHPLGGCGMGRDARRASSITSAASTTRARARRQSGARGALCRRRCGDAALARRQSAADHHGRRRARDDRAGEGHRPARSIDRRRNRRRAGAPSRRRRRMRRALVPGSGAHACGAASLSPI